MTTMASQITSLTVVYSIVNSGTDQRKHQSSASPGPVNSPHKGPVTREMFPFDDVIMIWGYGGLWVIDFFAIRWFRAVSIWRHRFTSITIHIIKIRQPHGRLSFIMWMPNMGWTVFILKRALLSWQIPRAVCVLHATPRWEQTDKVCGPPNKFTAVICSQN